MDRGARLTPPGPAITAETVAARLREVRSRVDAAGGDSAAVRIVAVTKGFGAVAAVAAAGAGLADVGENYAQELLAKRPEVDATLRWHLIGPPQRNKVKALAEAVDVWHAVDRLAAAEAIARHAPGATVYIQVDTTAEVSKAGAPPGETPALVASARAIGLRVEGLMTIGRAGDPAATRRAFATLRRLADDVGVPERSMGMSADLEVAVEEGTTCVRLGTALFGHRPPHGVHD